MIDKHDPRLTSFVLGELDDVASQQVASEIASSEALQREVAEIRAATQWLEEAFESEAVLALTTAQKQELQRVSAMPPSPELQTRTLAEGQMKSASGGRTNNWLAAAIVAGLGGLLLAGALHIGNRSGVMDGPSLADAGDTAPETTGNAGATTAPAAGAIEREAVDPDRRPGTDDAFPAGLGGGGGMGGGGGANSDIAGGVLPSTTSLENSTDDAQTRSAKRNTQPLESAIAESAASGRDEPMQFPLDSDPIPSRSAGETPNGALALQASDADRLARPAAAAASERVESEPASPVLAAARQQVTARALKLLEQSEALRNMNLQIAAVEIAETREGLIPQPQYRVTAVEALVTPGDGTTNGLKHGRVADPDTKLVQQGERQHVYVRPVVVITAAQAREWAEQLAMEVDGDGQLSLEELMGLPSGLRLRFGDDNVVDELLAARTQGAAPALGKGLFAKPSQLKKPAVKALMELSEAIKSQLQPDATSGNDGQPPADESLSDEPPRSTQSRSSTSADPEPTSSSDHLSVTVVLPNSIGDLDFSQLLHQLDQALRERNRSTIAPPENRNN